MKKIIQNSNKLRSNNTIIENKLFNLKNFCTFNTLKYDTSPSDTHRAQKGLMHLKRQFSGYQTCFSEKKSKRMWRVNVFRPKLYSNALQRIFARVHFNKFPQFL